MKYKGKNFEIIEFANIEINQAKALMKILFSHELNKDEHLNIIQMIGDFCYSASQKCYNYIEDPNNEDFTWETIFELMNKANKNIDEVWEFLKKN